MGLCVSFALWAQVPEHGKFYRIINASYGSAIKEVWGNGQLTCKAKDTSDYSQVWLYTADGAMQNVYTGKYIQPQGNWSAYFTTGTSKRNVTITSIDNGELTIAINGHYLHCSQSQGNAVVKWYNNADASHWTIEEVTLSAEDSASARNEYIALAGMVSNAPELNNTLKTFFTDELCDELKAEFAQMSNDELKDTLKNAGLPEMLQDIALKVKNDWWNDTSSSKFADENIYAETFRVASYEPYSDASTWSRKIKSYAPNYMGNPTGIYADYNDILHIFVGNDIPENATLYLTPTSGNARITSRSQGTELKKGYNVVVAPDNGLQYFVNYVVNTIDADGNITAPISSFPAMDIHIEGGKCIGFYEKPEVSSPQEDEKFQYLTRKAPSDKFFMVKGESTLFLFPAQTYVNVWPETIWNSINWFDRVQYWQFGLIGILDKVHQGLCENGTDHSKSGHDFNIKGGDAFYPTYCNNPSLAVQGADGSNPFATSFYTCYPGQWGVQSSFNAENPGFDNWCCGHEHGHMIQEAYNLESCKESSVNLGAQLIQYMTGYRMSRGGTFADNHNFMKQNKPFGLRDIGMTMRMYWNLYLYYHIAGEKKDFYPTFVQSLREDPMSFADDFVYTDPATGRRAGHHRATNTWIKFYKKACDAAQEDLTEYFRLWGFFVPCDTVMFGDYTSYWVSLSQAEIDSAIAEVKAKKYPENLQIMFIEDRLLLRPRTDIWANTASANNKYKPISDGTWKTQEQLNALYGDVGDVLTYIDGSADTSNYRYTLNGNRITMAGKGGVGFVVYDNDSSVVLMSNKLTFDIPAEIDSAGFVIKVINANGTSSIATAGSLEPTQEELLADLQAAIEASEAYTDMEDTSGKKIGYYSTSNLANLKAYVEDGKDAIKAGNVANYQVLTNSINTEIQRFKTQELTQQIRLTGLYSISSKRNISGNSKLLAENSSNSIVSSSTSQNNSLWAFVPASDKYKNAFYLQNRNSGKLISTVRDESGKITGFNSVTTDPEEACPFFLSALDNGTFGLRPINNTYTNIDPQGRIVTWDKGDEGSQWYITETQELENITDDVLLTTLNQAEELLNSVCYYDMEEISVTLQATDATQPFYLSTNEPEQSMPDNDITKAIDGNEETFFVSNYTDNAMTFVPHHLRIDLGEGNESNGVKFTLKGDTEWKYITYINVFASHDGLSWTWIGDESEMTAVHTTKNFTSKNAYRYWRFDVVGADGQHEITTPCPWFTIKEMEMSRYESEITAQEGFEHLPLEVITNSETAINEAHATLNSNFKTALNHYLAWTELLHCHFTLYAQASNANVSNSRILNNDNATGIDDINAEGAEDKAYDLSGRKLRNANAKGIYIVNGKMVIK